MWVLCIGCCTPFYLFIVVLLLRLFTLFFIAFLGGTAQIIFIIKNLPLKELYFFIPFLPFHDCNSISYCYIRLIIELLFYSQLHHESGCRSVTSALLWLFDSFHQKNNNVIMQSKQQRETRENAAF
jgi:hypothetical protein